MVKSHVAAHSFRLWKLKVMGHGLCACHLLSCSSFVPIVETERKHCAQSSHRLTVAAHSFRLWKLKANGEKNENIFVVHVAAHSFRLWKLKAIGAAMRNGTSFCCSSFVPIVETESCLTLRGLRVGLRRCSSFVPIVETESRAVIMSAHFHC